MSRCTQCPHSVGDAYQRDCAFPDCVGGWEKAFENAANDFCMAITWIEMKYPERLEEARRFVEINRVN